jgi:hypothetical protein
MLRLGLGVPVVDRPDQLRRLLGRERLVQRVRRRHRHEGGLDVVLVHPREPGGRVGEPLRQRDPVSPGDARGPGSLVDHVQLAVLLLDPDWRVPLEQAIDVRLGQKVVVDVVSHG